MQANLSILNLISQSDTFVKLILLLLIFASIFCWSIAAEKVIILKKRMKEAKEIEDAIYNCKNISELEVKFKKNDSNSLCKIFKFLENDSGEKSLDAFSSHFNLEKAIFNLEKNLIFLGTTASAAPFVGLFGTVWGIMHSFQTIGAAASPTLALVAPSIAEALLATAVGLFAAIPALGFYNYITNSIARFAARVDACIKFTKNLNNSF